jgi:hypothetical protein
MKLLDALVQRKSWSEPPFWAEDGRAPFLSTWSMRPDREPIGNDFEGYVRGAYESDGIVFACIAARQCVFSQGRFLWRDREAATGRLGDMYRTPELSLIERPWANGTTGELLSRMELFASLAGNHYGTTADDLGNYGKASRGGPNRRIVEMRPDWVTLIVASPSSVPGDPRGPYKLDARVVAFEYRAPGCEPILLLPGEVSHYSPVPDPLSRWRGMSWLTPVLREIAADKAATKHKLKFFENAATPNLAVSMAKEVTPDAFERFMALIDANHKGVDNAYKTLYTAGGADVTVIGADLKQLDFKSTQGAGETRIAAAARVHPVVVGLSEGLQGSSLNAGNYQAAKRAFADGWVRPSWGIVAPSLATLLERPSPLAELCVDDHDIPFLREDAKDEAEIQSLQAQSLRQLLDAGMDPDAAVRFLQNNDLSQLIGNHSGLFSVQLQPPGARNQPIPKG